MTIYLSHSFICKLHTTAVQYQYSFDHPNIFISDRISKNKENETNDCWIKLFVLHSQILLCANEWVMLNRIHHHHHHVVLSAQIFLTLSRHPSLSFIAFGRSSGLHPVSAQRCCMYVRAWRPAFARPCEGVHWSTYELVPTSPAVSCMSGASNFDSFRDRW